MWSPRAIRCSAPTTRRERERETRAANATAVVALDWNYRTESGRDYYLSPFHRGIRVNRSDIGYILTSLTLGAMSLSRKPAESNVFIAAWHRNVVGLSNVLCHGR